MRLRLRRRRNVRFVRPDLGAGSLLAVVAVLLASAGCPQRPPVVRPGPPPTAEWLLATLAARQAALHGINARARATSWVGGDRLRATVLMLVDRRGALRLEAEVSLQGTVSILTTQPASPEGDGGSDGRFQLLDLRNNRLQQGPACPDNVASLIRIPLAPAEVAAILLGDAKLPRVSPADASVTWDERRGADVLVVKSGAVERRIWFAVTGQSAKRPEIPEIPEILGAAAATAAGPLWRTSYEDFADAGAALRLPSTIRFAERGASFDDGVEIKFKDRTVNPELPPDRFVIAAPAGTEVIEVGCGPAPR